METNPSYAIGFVERYLELLSEDDVTASKVLEQFHVIEAAYNEAVKTIAGQRTRLEQIQLNLNGYKKI
jgi:hypothetical protein